MGMIGVVLLYVSVYTNIKWNSKIYIYLYLYINGKY